MSESRLERIENKIDAIKDELVQVKLGYIEHERRSLANEEQVNILKAEVKPVLAQVNFLHRLMVYAASVAAFVYSVLEIRSLLR